MAIIQLTQSQQALVDDTDYALLSQFKWQTMRVKHGFYATRTVTVSPGKERRVYMHRVIMGVDLGSRLIVVDHIDGNSLNNTRANLRLTDHKGNAANKHRPVRQAASGHAGVHWIPKRNRWWAVKRIEGRQISLGYYLDMASAIAAHHART